MKFSGESQALSTQYAELRKEGKIIEAVKEPGLFKYFGFGFLLLLFLNTAGSLLVP